MTRINKQAAARATHKKAIALRCTKCGHEWPIDPAKTVRLANGRYLAACPKCAMKREEKTNG